MVEKEKCKYLNEAIRVMETREPVIERVWSAQRREKANKRANKSTRKKEKIHGR